MTNIPLSLISTPFSKVPLALPMSSMQISPFSSMNLKCLLEIYERTDCGKNDLKSSLPEGEMGLIGILILFPFALKTTAFLFKAAPQNGQKALSSLGTSETLELQFGHVTFEVPSL